MGHNHVFHPHSTQKIFANTYFIFIVKEVETGLRILLIPFICKLLILVLLQASWRLLWPLGSVLVVNHGQELRGG